MDIPPNTTPNHSPTPIWYKIVAALFITLLAVLFLVFASGKMRHRMYNEVPPAGSVPNSPSQDIAH